MKRIILLFIIFIIGCYMICHSIKHMEKRKRLYIFLLVIGILIASLTIPFLINESYQYGITSERKYYTLWEAKDVLSFYGSFLSFIGTVALGALALWQNKKFKEENDIAQKRIENINDKLLELDSIREKEKLLEKYFAYLDETQKLFDIEYVYGRERDNKSTVDILLSIESCRLKLEMQHRKLAYLDEKNKRHGFYKFMRNMTFEMTDLINHDDKQGTMMSIANYWKNNKKVYEIKSKEFLDEIYNSIYGY